MRRSIETAAESGGSRVEGRSQLGVSSAAESRRGCGGSDPSQFDPERSFERRRLCRTILTDPPDIHPNTNAIPHTIRPTPVPRLNQYTTIERHYAAINSQDSDTTFSHHLEDFTIFPPDGGVLVESDGLAVNERMGSTRDFSALNVGMTNFNAQIYDSVALATFYLVGTETRGGKTRDITNRVSAVIDLRGMWE